jgi:hypothetical protein
MSKTTQPKKPSKTFKAIIIRHLREWHRKLGIFAALFLIFLSISGIALNHTEAFNLAHHPIKNQWLQAHYGIKSPSDVRFYEQNKLTVTDNYVWLNGSVLMEGEGKIISAGRFQKFWLVATTSTLSIFDNSGSLIDQMNSGTGLPSPITDMSISESFVILNTSTGYYQTDANLFDWTIVQTLVQPKWLKESKAEISDIENAKQQHQSQFLTLERIVLDAHSGRIFGDVGVLFMDLVAVFLILLSISGLYLWLRHWRAKR